MLTKSLHTVTAATAVAQHLVSMYGVTDYSTGAQLAVQALAILGHDVSASPEGCASDVTVARIVKACNALVESSRVPA
jgi:hypothetical protein